MIRNPFFVLRYLSGIPYLLPYGQMVADHKRGCQINSTGVYLWEQLCRDLTMEDLLSRFFADFDIEEDDRSSVRSDLEIFLSGLLRSGILYDSSEQIPDLSLNTPAPFSVSDGLSDETSEAAVLPSVCRFYRIAGIRIRMTAPLCIIPSELQPFADSESEQSDLTIQIKDFSCLSSDQKKEADTAHPLLRTYDLCVREGKDFFFLSFPVFGTKFHIFLSSDGTSALFYADFSRCTDESARNILCNNIFHALRHVFLFLAQKKGMAALHSASVLYLEKAWLFSGPSGTGKSTHTNLWHEVLNVPHINGDLNLLAFSEDVPMVYGIPWCGTSGRFTVNEYPLGGIILLKQAPSDRIVPLSEDQKRLLVSQRLISPVWTPEQFDANQHFSDRLADHILITRLCCTPQESAVTAIKNEIDRYSS